MLQEGGRGDPDFDEFITEAHSAAERGAELTRSLLAFARRQPLRPRQVDPNQLVSAIIALLRRTLGEHIQISLELAPDIWPVTVDPVQLDAALVNLATNARDAMPKGGRLSIVTANRQLDADYASIHTDVSPGDYVMLEVCDTGGGIAPDMLAKVFEPFFTTKPAGKGTGLGLSMVFGFMKQSGGHINVYSEIGVGTTFRLYLPRVAALAENIEDKTAQPEPRGNGESVLVVEDNPGLRRVAVRQLEQLGYRVAQADNAEAALSILERPETIDLVFTDIVLAGKVDGFDLARIVGRRWPHIKIVMTSGFPGNKHGEDAATPISVC